MNLLLTILALSFLTHHLSSDAWPETDKSTSTSVFHTEYQWAFINFTWASPAAYNHALNTQKYIPENNAMAGIKYYRDKFYISMPRIRRGTPVTLGYISRHVSKLNPLINPFPDWNTNNLDNHTCDKLENVQSMEIDTTGTMWVLDGFRATPTAKCPPKLVLYDLNTSEVVQVFTFPEEICLSRGGYLNDIVVDESDGGFAYITDASTIDPGLIVYSMAQKRAWKLRDGSMFPETDASNFVVDNLTFKKLSPINGIALSPLNPSGPRSVYYCALTGLSLHSISTDILKNKVLVSEGSWRYNVTYIGDKQAQSDGMMVDSEGSLFYGLLPLYGVGRWNTNEPFSSAEIVDQNNSTMIWPTSFSFDDKGFLYLLANSIHKFFDPDYELKIDGVKFRILKIFTATQSYLY